VSPAIPRGTPPRGCPRSSWSQGGTTRFAGPRETGCKEEDRFRIELEFVQCLSNPDYLHRESRCPALGSGHASTAVGRPESGNCTASADLARSRVLDDPSMINYIDYLQYWRRPEYGKHVIFPWCLHFLDLLTKAEFRAALKEVWFRDALRDQQDRSWRHYLKNRMGDPAVSST